ncbi:MAG TPA: SdpI family protein, partial [Caulobacteraceae bacterium]|nr:SdpI family protein [Caulobacteraceae bacterium]
IGILLVLIGAVLGRVPPNSLVGVRTPWTLADERVWRRTHYLTGRLMALAGVALAAAASLGADHTDLIVALAVCAVGPPILGAIYSRLIAGRSQVQR